MRIKALLLLLVSVCAVPGADADGMLDPSFGNGGLVTTDFRGQIPPPFDAATSLVVLPDGRAVAAGYTNPNLRHTDMAVARYLFSGALDTTFGGDGMVVIPFLNVPPPFDTHAVAEAVLLQPDGRLVLVGEAVTLEGMSFALVRLNADGSLDPTFGTGGVVTTPTGAPVMAGLLQPDGRIVAVGGATSVVAARYNADGSLDPSFGAGGVATVPISGGFDAEALALQADGKLVIAGAHPWPFEFLRDFALIRLLPGGALDPSFDGDGLATADFGLIEAGRSVIVLADGRLVVAGSRGPTNDDPGDFALVRFMADGSLDTTFGSGGLATADSGDPERAEQVIQLPNGKLLVAGSTVLSGPKADFLLARFHPDGPLDTSFGTGGFLRTDFSGSKDQCNALAIAGPDLLLTAGSSSAGAPDDFALARYIATIPVELLTFQVE
jgi:uncharacterized delta-60 repeat protein